MTWCCCEVLNWILICHNSEKVEKHCINKNISIQLSKFQLLLRSNSINTTTEKNPVKVPVLHVQYYEISREIRMINGTIIKNYLNLLMFRYSPSHRVDLNAHNLFLFQWDWKLLVYPKIICILLFWVNCSFTINSLFTYMVLTFTAS
jgi:hypothetical protein